MIKIKNWSSYQSYKDRKPPWIRFHKTMLDNYDYHRMSSDARALLPMLWLLASEDQDPLSGMIRDSYEKITFRLRMDLEMFQSAMDEIENAGFVTLINEDETIGDIGCNETVTKPLQDRNETVTPETETETETETERDREKYFFQGVMFNINHADKNRWIESYSTFDEKSLKSELQKLDDYYKSKNAKGNLFHRVSSCIAKTNQDRLVKGIKPQQKPMTAKDLEGAYDVR